MGHPVGTHGGLRFEAHSGVVNLAIAVNLTHPSLVFKPLCYQ